MDWKIRSDDKGNLECFYAEQPFMRFMEFIEKAGGKPSVMDYTDFIRLHLILKKLDGILIPGGRDIPPKIYGEKVNGSKVSPEMYQRYLF